EETARRLHQAGDDGAFKEAELCRRFAEIAMRCSIDPVCAGTEIHPVQIDFEELILREAALKPKGQQGLLDLASQAAFRTQEKNLRELLGDRAAALHNMPSAKVRNRGTQQTDGIDAEMAVEAAVL